jgi:hypothetical protein
MERGVRDVSVVLVALFWLPPGFLVSQLRQNLYLQPQRKERRRYEEEATLVVFAGAIGF